MCDVSFRLAAIAQASSTLPIACSAETLTTLNQRQRRRHRKDTQLKIEHFDERLRREATPHETLSHSSLGNMC